MHTAVQLILNYVGAGNPAAGRQGHNEIQLAVLQACDTLTSWLMVLMFLLRKKDGKDMGGIALKVGESDERLKRKINSKKCSEMVLPELRSRGEKE